jgi:hypothetical protein
MIAELDAKYQYEMKFNMFIETLLNAHCNTDEMNTLLCKKKIASNIELDTVKTNREALIKQQDETIVTRELFSRIAMLPQEIKKYIGSFSHAVINQKRLVKIEFYNNWIKTNKTRIVGLIKYWTKKDLALILDNINYLHNSYYNKLKAGTTLYNNSVPLILRSKIELLIDAKGRRSNIEMYGLLLSIEKYHAKKYIK